VSRVTSEAEWLNAFVAAVGLPSIGTDERDALLDLASTAAHASERTAAPLTCWLAGRSGLSLDEVLALAERLARELGGSLESGSGDANARG
jgi:hypothetical protein